jgi:hypothetical protein
LLTTADTSRDYIVGGTFHESLKRPNNGADAHGTLEVGYQIACTGESSGGLVVRDRPGTVYNVMLDKKELKGTNPWVMISGAPVRQGAVGCRRNRRGASPRHRDQFSPPQPGVD